MGERPEMSDDELAAEGYMFFSNEAVEFAEMSLPVVSEAILDGDVIKCAERVQIYREWSLDPGHREAARELEQVAEDAGWL